VEEGRFSGCQAMLSAIAFIMSLPSATLALLASLLLIGCATKQQQQFTPAQTALEKKDQRQWSKTEGRVP
jgi:outer membrane biogenesis lipoprotein LolB